MAHVLSLIFFPMSIGFMSHVDFKKRPCRPVDFKGQWPLSESTARAAALVYGDEKAALIWVLTHFEADLRQRELQICEVNP